MSDDDPLRDFIPYDSADNVMLLLVFETDFGVGGPQDQLEFWLVNGGARPVTVNNLVEHLRAMQTANGGRVKRAVAKVQTLWGKF